MPVARGASVFKQKQIAIARSARPVAEPYLCTGVIACRSKWVRFCRREGLDPNFFCVANIFVVFQRDFSEFAPYCDRVEIVFVSVIVFLFFTVTSGISRI